MYYAPLPEEAAIVKVSEQLGSVQLHRPRVQFSTSSAVSSTQ